MLSILAEKGFKSENIFEDEESEDEVDNYDDYEDFYN